MRMTERAAAGMRAGLFVAALAFTAAPTAHADDYARALNDASAGLVWLKNRPAAERDRQVALIEHRLDNTRTTRLQGRNANASFLKIRVQGKDGGRTIDTGHFTAAEKKRRTRRTGTWFAGEIVMDSVRANTMRQSMVHMPGILAGTDVRVSERLLIGNAIGAAFEQTGVGASGRVRTRTITDTLYGSYFTGKDSYVDMTIGGTYTDFDGRYCGGGVSTARDARQLFATARYSRLYGTERLRLRPYARTRFSVMDFGAMGSASNGMTGEASRKTMDQYAVGLASQSSFKTGFGRIAPNARIELSHNRTTASAATLELRDATGEVSGTDYSGSHVVLTGGINWNFSERTRLTSNYELTGNPGDFEPVQKISARFSLRF